MKRPKSDEEEDAIVFFGLGQAWGAVTGKPKIDQIGFIRNKKPKRASTAGNSDQNYAFVPNLKLMKGGASTASKNKRKSTI